MAFMQPEIFFSQYYAVEANHGETHIVPIDAVGHVDTWGALADYVEGTIDDPDEPAGVLAGWLARMSAPGYLDCTDWTAHETEAEAAAYLADYYGDDDRDDRDDDRTTEGHG